MTPKTPRPTENLNHSSSDFSSLKLGKEDAATKPNAIDIPQIFQYGNNTQTAYTYEPETFRVFFDDFLKESFPHLESSLGRGCGKVII